MQQRKQVDQLSAGDRFSLTLSVTAEVIDSKSTQDGSRLRIKPVPCGPACNEACSCAYRMLAAGDAYSLRIDSRQRVPFLGNLSSLLAESERIRAQIESLKNAKPAESAPK